ncbi:MAG: hypothetical protein ACI30S_06950 [Muribaculaceae bacterium]
MKKIYNILALATLVSLLASCTLMLDEPEIQPEEEVSGDGWSAPVIEKDEISEFRYQYQPDTRVIDESYLPYIQRMETDSTDFSIKLYMAKQMPKDMIPEKNAYITSFLSEELEGSVCHKVNLVEETNDGYILSGTLAPIEEVYKVYSLVSDGFVYEDTTNSRSGDDGLKVISLKEFYSHQIISDWPYAYSRGNDDIIDDGDTDDEDTDDEDGDLALLDLTFNYTYADHKDISVDFVFKNMFDIWKDGGLINAYKKALVETIIEDGYDPINNGKIIKYGTFDFGFFSNAGLYMRYHVDINLGDKKSEVWVQPMIKGGIGVGFKTMDGHVLLPILGNVPMTYKDRKNKVHTITKYWKNVRKRGIRIGNGTARIYFPYGALVDIYAELGTIEDDDYLGVGFSYEMKLFKVGYTTDKGFFCERPSIKYKASPLDADMKFHAGAKFEIFVGVGIELMSVLNAQVTAQPYFYAELSKEFKTPDIITPIPTKSSVVPNLEIRSNENLYTEVGVGVDLYGKIFIDTWGLWEKELANVKINDKPIVLPYKSYMDADFVMDNVEALSSDGNLTYYRALINVDRTGWGFSKVPRVAIYTQSKNFVKDVQCKNYDENHIIEKDDVYEYFFSLPSRDENGKLIDTKYYLMPYQIGGFGGFSKYAIASKPSLFSVEANYAKLNKFYNIDYTEFDKEYSGGIYTYGAAMDVTVNLVEPKAKIIMGISIKDVNGKTIKEFDICLDTATKRVDKKLYFSFYSNVWDFSGFTAEISFITVDNEGNWDYIDDSFKRTIEYGEGLKFPSELNDYNRLD